MYENWLQTLVTNFWTIDNDPAKLLNIMYDPLCLKDVWPAKQTASIYVQCMIVKLEAYTSTLIKQNQL